MSFNYQSTLDSFFSLSYPRRSTFFIDWTQEHPQAMWLPVVPKDCNFFSVVRWKNFGDVFVCCKEKKEEEKNEENERYIKMLERVNSEAEESNRRLVSFMKSHLQKSIRRRKQYKTLKSAKLLLLLDKDSLFRRLCIIVLEDSKLKYYFSNIMWLMAASSKKYKLKLYHIDYIFKVVNDICLCKDIEDPPCPEYYKEFSTQTFINMVNKDDNISEKDKYILLSLAFRDTYGGNEFDRQLVQGKAIEYYKKIKEGKNTGLNYINWEQRLTLNYCKCLDLKFSEVDELTLEAADNICNPRIIEELRQDLHLFDDVKDIETVIWEFSSGVNVRIEKYKKVCNRQDYTGNKKLFDLWEKIKDTLKRKQIKYIQNILEEIKRVDM